MFTSISWLRSLLIPRREYFLFILGSLKGKVCLDWERNGANSGDDIATLAGRSLKWKKSEMSLWPGHMS